MISEESMIPESIGRRAILISIYLLCTGGCGSLQLNIPVEVRQIKREDAASLVLVDT